jgi:predicted lipid-binding transport protein (Tim44 family)/uncharacterized tellurite resistance protein B-like protein
MQKDLRSVRKFLSDGVYQRFITQFKMMDILQQTNKLSDIKVKQVSIDKVETDGDFDILHVAISASLFDTFICGLDSSFNSGGYEEFIEYWSFIRRRGVTNNGMFDTQRCPNCDGVLEDGLGEVCVCPYCNSLLNSGEYDWVLSEITQAVDYVAQNPRLASNSSLRSQVERLVNENSDFSVQLVEDKASNGYLQIITAQTLGNPAVMRRFVSDDYYEKVKKSFDKNSVAYNRIYLNDVSLLAILDEEQWNKLFISVKASFQRIHVNDKNIKAIDPFVISETSIVVMKRQKNAALPKGSLYSHNCPNCGGKLEDTLETTCPYCGTVLNSSSIEWIIDDIYTRDEYAQYQAENKKQLDYSVDVKLLESMYDVRDYAYNNVLVIVAADHKIEEGEKQFIQKIAKKWGYNPKKIAGLLRLAFSDQLQIKMPADLNQRKKIIRLMENAAKSDGTVSAEEQKIIEDVKNYYLV